MLSMIIDTDIGTDIDDALALALAAKSGEAQLKAVTTVSGDTAARARIARHLLALCGLENVPVAAGLRTPGETGAPPRPPQYLPAEMDGEAPREDAVELILAAVRAEPEITIVTLGPLTNLAACIEREPQTMHRAKLVLMAGMVTAAFPEGNVASDPEAARTVLAAENEKRLVGLDVTAGCELEDGAARALLDRAAPLNACLYRMLRLWKQKVLAPILRQWGEAPEGDDYPASAGMHDPMAVAAALWPGLFRFQKAYVLVETQGTVARGLTLAQVNPFRGCRPTGYNADVAVRADEKAILARLTAALETNTEI